MVFRNREHAAQLLAKRLARYRGRNPLVLGVPRGAVPMAAAIAEALGGELDVILVHKLGAPGQPELAIGAVDEEGHVYLASTAGDLGIDQDYFEREREEQSAALRRRRECYTPARPRVSPAGRVVIVVDDGIATGSTLIAGLRSVRARGPERLVAAAAVAPIETVQRLKREADEVVVLHAPGLFLAVGEFFQDFRQTSDEEVVAALARSYAKSGAGAARPGAAPGGGCAAAPCEPAPAACEPSAAAPHWELFPHQADMGVRGIGPTPAEAFEQAALALTAVMLDPRQVRERESVFIRCESPHEDLLLVDWLNAIVYEMATRKMLFGRYEVRLEDHVLHGTAWGERVDVARHEPAVEIKGASLTELKVGRRADGAWIAQCVVDV